ncbi:MAG: GNAT family N-acetyltransferase, partial [Bacteroidota bacterium]|nr:GNAT family N-acetyltransferase [Bacteroidota bacterium]
MKKILETDRLILLPFSPEELEVLHRTFTDPFVRQYLWDDQVISREQTEEILQTNEEYFEKDNWGLWKIIRKKDQTYVGFTGLWFFFEEEQPQLLYGLLPEQTNKGYATEAAQAVLDYAFSQLHFPYLVAACNTPHLESKKVCERLGMQKVAEENVNNQDTTFYRIEAGSK